MTYSIAYPRKRLARGLLRGLGQLIVPALFRVRVRGRERFPERGPLLVVGNHVAAMEAVLMAVYTPWQVEMLGAADIPHEWITEIAMRVFGCIPVHRGRVDRAALRQALGVLAQGGILGIFPEGGIWEANAMRPQAGVAWLSYRARAPVLPIGFGGTLGALEAAGKLRRPALTMNVGTRIPAATLSEGKSKKAYLESYARRVIEAVTDLVPADDPARRDHAADERFTLQVEVRGPDGTPATYPDALAPVYGGALAKLLHRPAVLKILRQNLRLPVGPLQDLAQADEVGPIALGIESVLGYLRDENPYFLTYRFGPKEAEAMETGLGELLALARWAAASGCTLRVRPVRHYRSPETGHEILQTEQEAFQGWM
jgi:1-acyl-sn-glycerol-3-phosphate acyltransferase